MQRVRFTNQNQHTVTFELAAPYVFEKIAGVGAASVQINSDVNTGYDGNILFSTRMEDREITVNVHVKGDDRKEMYAYRQELIAMLSPAMSATGEQGRLEYTNDHGSWWIPAVVQKGPAGKDRAGNYQKSEQLVFYCADPFWRGMYPVIEKMAYQDDGFHFPLEIDINSGVTFGSQKFDATMFNVGDVPAPLEITITGPATVPKISKASTGEYIEVRRPLNEGDTLYINTGKGLARKVMITRSDGAQEDGFGYLSPGSTFFGLSPGENGLQFESGDVDTTARVILQAYPMYGGV